MSRSGYSDDIENWSMIRWRGQVASATRGARGQSFLRELLEALDAMPEKRLAAHSFKGDDGCMCTLGVIGAKRGIDLQALDKTKDVDYGEVDTQLVGETFGIAKPLAAEIMFENDEFTLWDPYKGRIRDDEKEAAARWVYMRDLVASQIKSDVR